MKPYVSRYYQNLQDYIRPGRVLVVYGPRRVGKTTLIKKFLNDKKSIQLSGDQIRTVETFSSMDERLMRQIMADNDYLFIDEAQKIPNIGQNIKLFIDYYPECKVILSGSSSFELSGQIGEPLTGRKIELELFPISMLELLRESPFLDSNSVTQHCLIYGSYPEVYTAEDIQEKQQILQELLNSYLFKDILELEKVKSSKIIADLLRLLAFQIGSEVSYSELASRLSIDTKTVIRYIDLLEKSFILYNLRGYSRNLRQEISRKSKYYFYDLGIRNAIINNFNELEVRDDIGALWENYLFIERQKCNSYQKNYVSKYFWRSWSQQEVDYLEESSGELRAYEFKYNEKDKIKLPGQFIDTYPDANFLVVNKTNYLDFITKK